MNQSEIKQLNNKFSLQDANNQLNFIVGKGNIPFIEVYNAHASAMISLQGAHVLSWIPKGEEEVIWLSEDAKFVPGKSIRGGIPICWPWFGAHVSNNDLPAHGFARTTDWQIVNTEILENGNTRVTLTLSPRPDTEGMWPSDISLLYQITIGQKLELELVTNNNGILPVTISQALHTYFKVGDISRVRLFGLDDNEYLDKADNYKRKVQHGPVTIEEEVDRIYLDTDTDCVIEDKSLGRSIIIIKCGSRSTVVWNPWSEVADRMGDLGKDGYKRMLCVESANAAEDVAVIEPGKAHTLWVQYTLQKL